MARPRITARCENDLAALPFDGAAALIDKLMEQRAQAPEAGDLIDGLRNRPCYSLHAGRYRAATWYDAARDIVWLLAAALHRSGSRDDFYNVAIHLEQTGQLYPTIEDYDAFAENERNAVVGQEALALRQLREDTIGAPDSRVRRYTSAEGLYAEMWAEVTEELALVVVRVRLMRLTGQWLTDTDLAILVTGALGPNARPRSDPDWLFRSFEEYFALNSLA